MQYYVSGVGSKTNLSIDSNKCAIILYKCSYTTAISLTSSYFPRTSAYCYRRSNLLCFFNKDYLFTSTQVIGQTDHWNIWYPLLFSLPRVMAACPLRWLFLRLLLRCLFLPPVHDLWARENENNDDETPVRGAETADIWQWLGVRYEVQNMQTSERKDDNKES